jgi:hypothetical protein
MADLRHRNGSPDGFPAAVISRAIIHIDGAPGAGKTAFVERLLGALDEWVLAVRCRRDESFRQARESSSARDPEVRRYRAAGASDAGRFAFPSGRDAADDFFTSRLLTDVSDVVVIEGDSPLRGADLRVFVASPPAVGQTLLVRERRNRAAQRARADAMERLPPAPTEHWAVAGGYAGIEHAQLVVLNVREDAGRERARGLLEEVRRLRADRAVFDDVLGWRGSRVPITAVVADLADPREVGTRKAVARVKRSVRELAGRRRQ